MSPDTVRIMCPNLTCRKVLAVPGNARGKTVRCKNCGTNIRVPGGGANGTPEAAKAQQKPSAPAA
jgi:ribosomal protein S27E